MDCEPQSSTVKMKKKVTFGDQVEVFSSADGVISRTVEKRPIGKIEMRMKEDDDLAIENQFDIQMEILTNVGGNPLENIQEFTFPYFQCASPCLTDFDLDADTNNSSSSVSDLFKSMNAASSKAESCNVTSSDFRRQGVMTGRDPPEQGRAYAERQERNVFEKYADHERAKAIIKDETDTAENTSRRVFLIPADSGLGETNSESDENSDTRCPTPIDLTMVDSETMFDTHLGEQPYKGDRFLPQENLIKRDEEVREEVEASREECRESEQYKRYAWLRVAAIEAVADDIEKNAGSSNLKKNGPSHRTMQLPYKESSPKPYTSAYDGTKTPQPQFQVDAE